MIRNFRAAHCFPLAASLVWLISGCAPPPPPPAPPPASAQVQTISMYGAAMIRTIASDGVFQQLLRSQGVTGTLDIGLVVEPNGYVDKSFVAKSSVTANVATPVLLYLNNINFGAFTPGMPNHSLVFLIPVAPAGQGAALCNPAFHVQTVALYQPNAALQARLGTAGPLAYYINVLEASLATAFAEMPQQPGVTAAVVMGVKPGLLSRAWVVAPAGALSPARIARIEAVAEAVPPVAVQQGPIAFAIVFSVWGGGAPITDAQHPVPMPPEWFAGAPPGPMLVPDGIFARIWP